MTDNDRMEPAAGPPARDGEPAGGPDLEPLDASVWFAAVMQSPFSTVIYDAEGHPLVANAAFAALWGVDVGAAPPGYSVLTDPELERQGILQYIRRAFAGEAVMTPLVRYDISKVSTTGTGHTLWTQAHLYPLRDRAGRVTHVVLSHVDLTDRVTTEEALQASERRFGAIIGQASAGIAQVDLTGRFLLVNDRYCELVGRPREELLGMRMQDLTHPDDLPANLQLFRKALETGERFTIEKRYLRPDGSLVWVNNSVTAVTDETGEPGSVLAVSVDITDRRRAEDTIQLLAEAGRVLAASLDHHTTLRSIAELMVPAVARWSMVFLADGGMIPVATACAVPEKLAAVERMARRIAAMPAPERHPARVALETGEPQLVPVLDGAFLDGVSRDPEYRRLIGELAPTSVIAVPLVARGRVLGALLLVTDEPSRQFDDRDLALATELAQRAAAAVDNARLYQAEQTALARTRRLQQITARLAAMLPAGEVAGLFATQVREAFGADTGWLGLLTVDRTEFVTLAHTGLAEGMGPWLRFPADAPIPAADVARDGLPRWFCSKEEMCTAYPATAETVARIDQEAVAFLPLAAGSGVSGVMSLGFREQREFTDGDREFALALARQCAQALERARLYEAERAARAEAEEANRAKGQFLATMSHELRTPLNAIGGYAELIDIGVHGPVTPDQRGALERIQINQRHLLSLINEILDFSRVEAGTLRLTLDEVDAGSVMATLDPMIGAQIRSRGIAFHCVHPDPPAAVRGDRERIVQVCLNLLSNALKATPAGGSISIACEPAGETVMIRVRDTGAGIPAAHLETIFNPFTQVGRALDNPKEGVGLGLAISRELARAMGGDLVAESELGAGSVFTLVLRRA